MVWYGLFTSKWTQKRSEKQNVRCQFREIHSSSCDMHLLTLASLSSSRSGSWSKKIDMIGVFLEESMLLPRGALPIKTKEEAIILASVIEKETGVTSERDMVAGLFINRLNKGMRLQSDPTIIYGITGGDPLGRGIRQSELDRVTDWNTYQMDGLPKTPICNPGRDAIAAVLQPAKTDYLYFVADGSGGHVFAKTLAKHNENVKNWRKVERGIRQRQRAAAQAKQD